METLNEDRLKEYIYKYIQDALKYQPFANHIGLETFLSNLSHQTQHLNSNNLTRQNPLVAGTSVEKKWEEILSECITESFAVHNKVMIELPNGEMSSEKDIVITKYHPKMSDPNYINHEFVVAVFEVKKNLRTSDLDKIYRDCEQIKKALKYHRSSTQTDETILFGLLANTSNLSSKFENDKNRISRNKEEMKTLFRHIKKHNWKSPLHCIDTIIVADAFSTSFTINYNYKEKYPTDWLADMTGGYSEYISGKTATFQYTKTAELIYLAPNNNTLANFLYHTLEKLVEKNHVELNSTKKSLFRYQSIFHHIFLEWSSKDLK